LDPGEGAQFMKTKTICFADNAKLRWEQARWPGPREL
jgi:hypothetical protein